VAHILVVEDDEQFRGMLGKVLERAGHSVTLASNGA
jgi:CheY-like chemotaxis protein